jgi:hypothetical protein
MGPLKNDIPKKFYEFYNQKPKKLFTDINILDNLNAFLILKWG